MTKSEEMKRLEADLASDRELKEKFEKTVDRIATEGKPESDAVLFAQAAAELGYGITAADFERLDAEKEEVSADELQNLAGGLDTDQISVCWIDYNCVLNYVNEQIEDEHGHNMLCLTAWHCFTVTLHTETDNTQKPNERGACWKDYDCVIVNK